ncbi:MAG: DUF4249 domain-containing protein [Flavobacteriaceae bacterium]
MIHKKKHIPRPLTKLSTLLFLFVLTSGALDSCTEPFSLETASSDNPLVVDATITNELKNHEILLSRAAQAGGDGPLVETNANIRVVDDTQQEFLFVETEPGRYISSVEFSALPNRTYRLAITTSNGNSYSSDPVQLPQTTQIDNVHFKRTTTDSGLDGMAISVDSFDPTGNATYYKYEYEETYKIIAPRWVPDEFVILSEDPPGVDALPRTREEKTCYATERSNSLILTNTDGSGEGRVTDFNVQFINRDNFIISHRYSILIKQHVLSREAYSFYEKLQEFSGSESLFSQSQPGFIKGNIFSEDGKNERVVGIFNISSVSEKREFFNYVDFFPEEELPPFVDDCRQTNLLFTTLDDRFRLIELIKSNSISFSGFIFSPEFGTVIGVIHTPRKCGDCNELGSNVAPDFWEE